MTPELIFSIVNLIALLSWLALILRPRHPLVQRWTSVWAPLGFAVLYVAIVAVRIRGAGGDFSSLAGVAELFRDPWFLLAGWIHYLAFDLLIGVWEVRDAETRGLPSWRVVPCQVLTFLFGPAGWLLYLGVRSLPTASRARS
jgi:hypothetical protein